MRTLIASIAVCLTLTACSDNDPPPPSGYPTPTGTSSTATDEPSPSETQTVDPTEETARQFITRFVEAGNEMQTSGDSKTYRSMIGPDCTSCSTFADLIDGIYEHGGKVITDGERVIEIAVGEQARSWLVTIHGARTVYWKSDHSRKRELPGGRYEAVFYLLKDSSGWLVAETERLAAR